MEIFRTIAKISLFYCWGILILGHPVYCRSKAFFCFILSHCELDNWTLPCVTVGFTHWMNDCSEAVKKLRHFTLYIFVC